MATGYIRDTAEFDILHNAASKFTTQTAILTVTAGHIYWIKQLTIRGLHDFSNATVTGSIGFEVIPPTHNDANDDYGISSRIAPASDVNATRFFYEFAWPHEAAIVNTMPATTVVSKTAFDPGKGQERNLYNRQLIAGEILRFSPLDAADAGYGSGTGTNNIEFNISVSFLDYTL